MEPERYSAETKAWLELWSTYKLTLAKTNDREFRTTAPATIDRGTYGYLVTSVDGVEHRRRIRITGGVAWEYEEITETGEAK